jgi:hypothetical protein
VAEAMKAYTVKTTVKHDGKVYKKGDKIQLTAEQAALLLKGASITSGKIDAQAE